jgi:hemoglobin
MFTELSEASIEDQVRRFYIRARGDDLLGPVFAGAISDWEPHLRDISDFWIGALLGVRRYKGDPMGAHLRHALTPEMFDRWLGLWAETADEGFAGAAAQTLKSRAEMIGRSLRAGLLLRPA